MTDARTPSSSAVRRATTATYVAFIGSGFAFASWAARIPQVRDHLGLSPAALGLVLLAIAAGSIVALPLSGPVVTRIGSSRTVLAMAVLLGVGLAIAGIGSFFGVVPLAAGLFLLGFANGAWDVAMNVQGTVVERHLGKSIMSRFHAGFSLGTVAGALLGAAMVALHVPVAAHLAVVAALVTLAVTYHARRFVPDQNDTVGAPRGDTPRDGAPNDDTAGEDTPGDDTRRGGTTPGEAARGGAAPGETAGGETAGGETAGGGNGRGGAARGGAFGAWREPRTLLIGVFVLAFAFAEGTGNDWISVASIDGHHVSAALGTLTFAGFLTAMTVGRWFGPALLDRFGRTPVVRVLALLGIAGLALFVFGPSPAVAYAGALLWGLGASLGFPVGMSAGGDDPRKAAARVSVIASIGYCAFLAGPPTIGFLGNHFTVLRALTVVAALLAVAALIAGAVRPPENPATS